MTVEPIELSVTEGGSAEYTVVLDTRPAETVKVTPTSDDPNLASVGPPLIFEPENWNAVQDRHGRRGP